MFSSSREKNVASAVARHSGPTSAGIGALQLTSSNVPSMPSVRSALLDRDVADA